jgi:glutaminase
MNNTIVISPKINSLVNVTKKVLNSPTGVSFVNIKGYESTKNEISNQLINVGASYPNAVSKDIEYLENLDVNTLETSLCKDLLNEAKLALIKGLKTPNKNRSQAQKDAYKILTKGIKVHNENRKLYIYGYLVSKDVIQKGTYQKVNSRPLTIAKRFLKKNMRTAKFRHFIIEMSNSIK